MGYSIRLLLLLFGFGNGKKVIPMVGQKRRVSKWASTNLYHDSAVK